MSDSDYTTEDEIRDCSMARPHVVILGAGASLAATPNGDESGRRLPLMWNFVKVVGLEPVLATHGIAWKPGDNFEALYASLADDPRNQDALLHVEATVAGYFRALRLPAEPTIYDHLVLSLREKDLIATFNWDPFLYEACYRNHAIAPLPHVVYLHGSVASGYCLKHRKKGPPGARCSVCREPFTPSKLLFPIAQKNYTDDVFIRSEWATLKRYLADAFQLTLFGYGAPASDVEAVGLMKEAWGEVKRRELEQTEIIDIRDADELAELWSPFIHSHHYEVHKSLGASWLAKRPRRTCEAARQQFMEAKFFADNPAPSAATLAELEAWFRPLIDAERAK